MARKRVVSRTITTTIVTAMVTNIKEGAIEYRTVTLAGAYNDTAKLEKAVRKLIENPDDGIKFNCVTDVHRDESLYALEEDEFIKVAKKVQKRAEA